MKSKKNSTLPSIRIDSELHEKINKAIAFINENAAKFEINESQYRRMALSSFSEKVLHEGLILEFKPK